MRHECVAAILRKQTNISKIVFLVKVPYTFSYIMYLVKSYWFDITNRHFNFIYLYKWISSIPSRSAHAEIFKFSSSYDDRYSLYFEKRPVSSNDAVFGWNIILIPLCNFTNYTQVYSQPIEFDDVVIGFICQTISILTWQKEPRYWLGRVGVYEALRRSRAYATSTFTLRWTGKMLSIYETKRTRTINLVPTIDFYVDTNRY